MARPRSGRPRNTHPTASSQGRVLPVRSPLRSVPAMPMPWPSATESPRPLGTDYPAAHCGSKLEWRSRNPKRARTGPPATRGADRKSSDSPRRLPTALRRSRAGPGDGCSVPAFSDRREPGSPESGTMSLRRPLPRLGLDPHLPLWGTPRKLIDRLSLMPASRALRRAPGGSVVFIGLSRP